MPSENSRNPRRKSKAEKTHKLDDVEEVSLILALYDPLVFNMTSFLIALHVMTVVSWFQFFLLVRGSDTVLLLAHSKTIQSTEIIK